LAAAVTILSRAAVVMMTSGAIAATIPWKAEMGTTP